MASGEAMDSEDLIKSDDSGGEEMDDEEERVEAVHAPLSSQEAGTRLTLAEWEVLDLVNEYQVMILQGETGSGKTT